MCFSSEKDDTPAPRPAAQASPRNSQSGSIRSRTSRKSEKKRQENEKQAQQNQNGEASSSAPAAAPPTSPPADTSNGYAPPAGPPPAQFSAPSGPPPGHEQPASPPAPAPVPQDTGEWFAPPPGPPPGWAGETSFNAPPGPPPGEYDAPAGPPPGAYNAPPGPPPGQYDAPTGPPPGQFDAPPGPPPAQFDAPSGPPPGERWLSNDEHAPPAGPPPGHQASEGGFAPPAGPPPAQFDAPAGPPPGVQSVDGGFAPPSGPPPAQFDAPAGPPPGVAYAAPSSPPPIGDVAPPAGPPPGFASPDGPPPATTRSAEEGEKSFAPPAGPPPSDGYAPPPGPPPADGYGPPPGPPPVDYAPPSGPPPPEGEKSQHNWQQVIPDTALFPPPPAFFTGHVRSHTNNATHEEADAGNAWCEQNPLLPPTPLPPQAFHALQTHNINLMQPQVYHGTLVPKEPGVWEGRTEPNSRDSCIIGFPPLYSAVGHSPLATGQPFKIYYEVYIRPDSKAEEVDLALGFTALPYPNFRMPGWHRGSLAVHGDDGHKYINDQWGGKDFTEPFKVGQTYGIGMAFSAREDGSINVDVFFTRDGKLDGSWNLHEESDANEDLPVFGLEGFNDLTCAIGTFDRNSFEIIFDPAKWKYQP